MNGAVVYQSKYGSTRQYAEWISESLQMKLINVKEINAEDLRPFTHVVFCSPVYFGRVLISKFFKKNWNILKKKKNYILLVASMDENATEDIKTMVNANFDLSYQEKMKWFYAGGRMEIEKLNFFEKFITKRLGKIVKGEREKNKLEKGYDMVERKKLDLVIDTIKRECDGKE